MKQEEEEVIVRIEEEVGNAGGRRGAVPTHTHHSRGVRFSEVWEYFHIAPPRTGHHPSQYAACRLCGRQVSRGPGLNVGTTALWKHLRSMHREELEKSGHRQVNQCPVAHLPVVQHQPVAEGEWAQLMEQMGGLALRASQREREVEKREKAVERRARAVERRERAVERRERAVEEKERSLTERMLKMKAEEVQVWLKGTCERESGLGSAAALPMHFA
ncbi:zinc finger BED domain-containing protein 2 [Dermochelys coriacea]|uniref:zinc finger BED domain-containing protein 2 n=1 Tax=Dermochelys coriacea TaxID=27794 RepID=UPI0018E782F4|nr:zinc finger BED domain-containing protein 2 [Dermochelys coriacea]